MNSTDREAPKPPFGPRPESENIKRAMAALELARAHGEAFDRKFAALKRQMRNW